MALQSIASGSKKYFTILSSSAGSGGTVYTVPAGKSFVGHFYLSVPNSNSHQAIILNGSQLQIGNNGTYGTWYAFPINLSAGDVIANNSTYYFTLTGYEE